MSEIQKEQIRLLNSPVDQDTIGLGARFIVICPGNAPFVMSQGKDIILAINKYSFPDSSWPSMEQWIHSLPPNFTSRFMSENENINAEEAFSLETWLYWMKPQKRTWYWWDSALFSDPIKDTHFVVSVKSANELPCFSATTLKWLFKACGADNIISEDDL